MDGFFKIDKEHILELLRIVDKDVNWFNYSITEILHVSRFFCILIVKYIILLGYP